LRLRFQADADFNNTAVRAIHRRWACVDLQAAQEVVADRVSDQEVLILTASEDRVLLTHDVSTMPDELGALHPRSGLAGVILVPQEWPIGLIVQGVYLAWPQWTPEDLRNSIRWLPDR